MTCEACTMPDEHRLTIRLPADLYTQLVARAAAGPPLAALVRQALLEYVARQPEAPPSPADLATTLAALAARLDGLQDQVEALTARLDTLAADGQPRAATAADPPTPSRIPRGRRQLAPRQVRALRDKHLRGVPVPALMEEYGISRASVFRYLQSSKRRETSP
jgi:hypothetical protein